jgi:hypothetical protein
MSARQTGVTIAAARPCPPRLILDVGAVDGRRFFI